jgi:hypothetical protein
VVTDGTRGVYIQNYTGLGSIGTSSNNALAFTINSVEKMRLDTSGNLGLGVTPSAWTIVTPALQVSNASLVGYNNQAILSSNWYYNAGNKYIANGYATQYTQTSGTHIWYTAGNNVSGAGAVATFTQAMTLNASGSLLVGRTSDGLTNSGAGISKNAGGAYIEVVQGTTGVACMYLNQSNGTGTQTVADFRYNNTQVGTINVTSTLTSYNATSDYRLKTVIGTVTGHGERLDALEPVEYTWNSNGSRTRGFLAHKFQEVYADSVTGTKDAVDADGKPVYQSMQASTSEVIADLVAEIQSLRKRLADAGIA